MEKVWNSSLVGLFLDQVIQACHTYSETLYLVLPTPLWSQSTYSPTGHGDMTIGPVSTNIYCREVLGRQVNQVQELKSEAADFIGRNG